MLRAAVAPLLLILLVLAIGWTQGEGRFAVPDQRVMSALAETRVAAAGAVLTPLARLATGLGDSETRVAIAAAVALYLLYRRRRAEALWLAGAVAGGALLNWSLKQLFARARPELVEHLVNVHSYSFPSGHAANSVVICFALAILAGRRWGYALAALVAFAIGTSRVYLGVHWPSDVVAGWITGTAWVIVISGLRHREALWERAAAG